MRSLFLILLFLTSTPLFAQTTTQTILNRPSLTAGGTSQDKIHNISFTAPNPAAIYRLTLLNADGGAHAVQQTCSGNIIQRLLCVATNLIQTAYVSIFRVNSVVIVSNNVSIYSNSSFKNLASYTGNISLKASNQLQVRLRGPATSYIQLKIELISAPKAPTLSNVLSPASPLYSKQLPVSLSISFDSDIELSGAKINALNMTLSADKKKASLTFSESTAGNKTYVLEATSTAGLKTTRSLSLNLILDQTAPLLTAADLPALTNLSTLQIPIQIADSSPTTTDIYVNNVLAFSTGSQNFEYVLNMPNDGAYNVHFVTTDTAGNSSTKQLSTTRDASPLVLTILSPPAGTTIRPGKFEVRFTASRALSSAMVNGAPAILSEDLKSGSLMLEYLSEGSYLVTVNATDTFGSTANRSVSINFQNDQMAVWKYQECPINE